MPANAAARHPATIARQGSFETLTNVNERDSNGNATNSNVIERYVMSADGSTAVYAMTQDPLTAPCTSNRQIRRVDIATGQDDLVGEMTWTVSDTSWNDSGVTVNAKIIDLEVVWPVNWDRDRVRLVTLLGE